jgi:murein L,D-transpeptidase YcbB/YkuD
MQRAIERYEKIRDSRGWSVVPDGSALKLGDESARISSLQERLLASGDLSPRSSSPSTFYSETLEEAVRRFQIRHGLEVDGIVGRHTLAALNVSVSKRLETLRINLERSKRFEGYLESYFVVVNIAGFELAVVKDNDVKLRSAIIAGKPYQKTPVFSDKIRFVEFHPSWHIPASIVQAEILPALRKNPHYLEENRMIASPGTDESHIGSVRQTPGPWNALGRIKVGFPNAHSVYLHDTPTKYLFHEPIRSFSHGCIRVEKIEELAELLLTEDSKEWGREFIREILREGKNKRLDLKSPVSIHIIYRTAWVDVDHSVNFRSDIYQRDLPGKTR